MFATRGDSKRRRGSTHGADANTTTTTVSRILSSFSSNRNAVTGSLSLSSSRSSSRHHQPLRGVVACLSGYTSSEKDELHELIERLGGRYTRDFSLDENTHLITEAPHGAKYDLAATTISRGGNNNNDNDGGGEKETSVNGIYIVKRSWLDACATPSRGSKVPEGDHKLLLSSDRQRALKPQDLLSIIDGQKLLTTKKSRTRYYPSGGGDDDDDDVSRHPVFYRSDLFSSLQFYLLGLQEDQNHLDTPRQLQELRNKLALLIRRGGGTIYWELNEDVNIVVLCDGCDHILYKAAEVLSIHHPQLPPSVSPLWVVESWKQQQLQPIETYRPTPAPPVPVSSQQQQDESRRSADEPASFRRNSVSSTSALVASKSSASSHMKVFHGCLFTTLRIPPQHEQNNVLDYDSNEQETFIRSHGGQVLSQEILTALRADLQTKKQQSPNHNEASTIQNGKSTDPLDSKRRRCYVVCWGDADGPPRLEMNHLLAQAQREHLVDAVIVTPVWLKTCVDVRKCVRPDRLPMVLQPQHWPFRTLLPCKMSHLATTQTKEKKGNALTDGNNFEYEFHHTQKPCKRQKKQEEYISPTSTADVHISLTGFQGTEKVALIHLIDAIGGTYHDNMSPSNTHLICKEKAIGLKREKAIEWNIKVVKIDWLYHILQYGIEGFVSPRDDHLGNHQDRVSGSGEDPKGCEHRFSGL